MHMSTVIQANQRILIGGSVVYLSINAVSKSFGNVRAVNNVSFTCDEGDLVAILGPSGCGKTTLLRIVAGFETADSGTVSVAGTALGNMVPEARRIGMLFQNYALFPHMNVAQNIAYGLRFQRKAKEADIQKHVSELLELVDLPGYGDRRPDQLSAGQQQRVAIARALAPKPRLLLLDEPLSALDVSLRDHLRLNFRRIQRELRLTTLYVTHDQEEAMSIADHIVLMRAGVVEQRGSPETIYEQPTSGFAATFFGRTALIPAHFIHHDNARGDELAVLRAERLHTDGPGVPLRGLLEEVEYFGHMVRLQVRGEFGTVWGTAPGDDIRLWTARRGEHVSLYVRPEVTPTVRDSSDE